MRFVQDSKRVLCILFVPLCDVISHAVLCLYGVVPIVGMHAAPLVLSCGCHCSCGIALSLLGLMRCGVRFHPMAPGPSSPNPNFQGQTSAE